MANLGWTKKWCKPNSLTTRQLSTSTGYVLHAAEFARVASKSTFLLQYSTKFGANARSFSHEPFRESSLRLVCIDQCSWRCRLPSNLSYGAHGLACSFNHDQQESNIQGLTTHRASWWLTTLSPFLYPAVPSSEGSGQRKSAYTAHTEPPVVDANGNGIIQDGWVSGGYPQQQPSSDAIFPTCLNLFPTSGPDSPPLEGSHQLFGIYLVESNWSDGWTDASRA